MAGNDVVNTELIGCIFVLVETFDSFKAMSVCETCEEAIDVMICDDCRYVFLSHICVETGSNSSLCRIETLILEVLCDSVALAKTRMCEAGATDREESLAYCMDVAGSTVVKDSLAKCMDVAGATVVKDSLAKCMDVAGATVEDNSPDNCMYVVDVTLDEDSLFTCTDMIGETDDVNSLGNGIDMVSATCEVKSLAICLVEMVILNELSGSVLVSGIE